MSDKTIRIEFTEKLNVSVNLDVDNQTPFKYELLKKIKEILNVIDVDDFRVWESGEEQQIILKIDNEKF